MHRSLAGLALLPFFVLAAPIHAGEPDTQPPMIESVTFSNRGSGTLLVPLKASDNVGLAQAVATIDGASAASATFDASGMATLSIDTTKFANGKHNVEVRALDAAGNRSGAYDMEITFENAVVTPTPTAMPEETATPAPTPIVQQPHDRPTPTPTPVPLGEIGILGDEATRYTTRDFLSIPKRPRASKAGTLTLTARCPLPKTCSLRVSLTRAGKTFGSSGRVVIKSKGTAKVSLKLTKSARASLKRKPQSLRLTVAGYAGVVITLR